MNVDEVFLMADLNQDRCFHVSATSAFRVSNMRQQFIFKSLYSMYTISNCNETHNMGLIHCLGLHNVQYWLLPGGVVCSITQLYRIVLSSVWYLKNDPRIFPGFCGKEWSPPINQTCIFQTFMCCNKLFSSQNVSHYWVAGHFMNTWGNGWWVLHSCTKLFLSVAANCLLSSESHTFNYFHSKLFSVLVQSLVKVG